MKTKLISLAFMLVFTLSTATLADDGETGHGNRTQDPPPAGQSESSSNDLLTQILNALVTVVP